MLDLVVVAGVERAPQPALEQLTEDAAEGGEVGERVGIDTRPGTPALDELGEGHLLPQLVDGGEHAVEAVDERVVAAELLLLLGEEDGLDVDAAPVALGGDAGAGAYQRARVLPLEIGRHLAEIVAVGGAQ